MKPDEEKKIPEAGAAQPALSRALAEALKEQAEARAESERLQRRWHEIHDRQCRDENRKARFLKRLDDEMAGAHHRMVMADANVEGLSQ